MRAGRTFYNLIAVIVLIASTLLALFSGVSVAYAATTHYSDILDDLRQDSTFNVADYPAVNDDYSLNVFQVAESIDNELFVYVYQPAAREKQLTATSVNLSLDEPIDDKQTIASTTLYSLTFLNSAGVFQKYRVDGLTVSSKAKRYYNITSIYRKWVEGDEKTGNDNEPREVAFEVGKMFIAETIDDNVKYSVFEQKTIKITNKWNSYLLYYDGYFLTQTKKTASFFVAFDCNYDIENLLEADLTYTTRSFEQVYKNGIYYAPTYGKVSDPKTLTLHYDDYGSNVNRVWLFGEKTTWKRIQSKSEFMSTDGNNLTDYAKQQLADKKWVLRFLDTSYGQTHSTNDWGDYYSLTTFTEVNDVAILRLKFETQGTTYNLGVVDNKQSVSKDPANVEENWLDIICKWLEKMTGIPAWIWKIIICALPFLILLPVLSFIFPVFGQILGQVLLWIVKAVGKVLLWLLKAVLWLIALPFRGIAALIRKRKATPKTGGKELRPSRTSHTRGRNTNKTKPRAKRKK